MSNGTVVLEPEVVESVQEYEAVVLIAEAQSQAIAITCQADYDQSGEAMVDFGKMAANIEKARKDQVAPHNARVGRINAAYKAITERLTGVVNHYAGLRKVWKQEQTRLQDEAERVGEEARKKEQKRLDDLALERAKRAEAKGDTQKAEEILASVPQAPPPPVPYMPPVAKTAGLAEKTYWFCTVKDFGAMVTAAAAGEIDLACLAANESWLKKNAQALKRYSFLNVTSDTKDVRTGR